MDTFTTSQCFSRTRVSIPYVQEVFPSGGHAEKQPSGKGQSSDISSSLIRASRASSASGYSPITRSR